MGIVLQPRGTAGQYLFGDIQRQGLEKAAAVPIAGTNPTPPVLPAVVRGDGVEMVVPFKLTGMNSGLPVEVLASPTTVPLRYAQSKVTALARVRRWHQGRQVIKAVSKAMMPQQAADNRRLEETVVARKAAHMADKLAVVGLGGGAPAAAASSDPSAFGSLSTAESALVTRLRAELAHLRAKTKCASSPPAPSFVL